MPRYKLTCKVLKVTASVTNRAIIITDYQPEKLAWELPALKIRANNSACRLQFWPQFANSIASRQFDNSFALSVVSLSRWLWVIGKTRQQDFREYLCLGYTFKILTITNNGANLVLAHLSSYIHPKFYEALYYIQTGLFKCAHVIVYMNSSKLSVKYSCLACPARLHPICVRSEARRTRGRLTGQSNSCLIYFFIILGLILIFQAKAHV